MARGAFILTVLLFFFAFAYARIPFDLPATDVTDLDPSSSLPESDSKPTLFLSSEKPQDERTTVVKLEPETAEAKPLGINTNAKGVQATEDLPVSEKETLTLDAVLLNRPLTMVRFRPINRHFPAKRPFPFRIYLRGCHHGIKPMIKPRIHGREVSFGNDMILASESKPFYPEMFRGSVRQIPARWVKFGHRHHHHEGIPLLAFEKHHDKFAKQRVQWPVRHEEVEEEEKGREEREEGGFMKRIRKFLNHF